jgi:hypothetical protein
VEEEGADFAATVAVIIVSGDAFDSSSLHSSLVFV